MQNIMRQSCFQLFFHATYEKICFDFSNNISCQFLIHLICKSLTGHAVQYQTVGPVIIVLRTCAVLLVSCQDKSLVTIIQMVEIFSEVAFLFLQLYFYDFFLNVLSKQKLQPFGHLAVSNVVGSVRRLFTETIMSINAYGFDINQ